MKSVDRRRELLAELQQLLLKRETEVAEKLKAAAGTDDAIILSPFEVLTEQAESKGCKFNKK